MAGSFLALGEKSFGEKGRASAVRAGFGERPISDRHPGLLRSYGGSQVNAGGKRGKGRGAAATARRRHGSCTAPPPPPSHGCDERRRLPAAGEVVALPPAEWLGPESPMVATCRFGGAGNYTRPRPLLRPFPPLRPRQLQPPGVVAGRKSRRSLGEFQTEKGEERRRLVLPLPLPLLLLRAVPLTPGQIPPANTGERRRKSAAKPR